MSLISGAVPLFNDFGESKAGNPDGISRFMEHNVTGMLIEAIELTPLNLGAPQIRHILAADGASSKPRTINGDGFLSVLG